MDQPSNYIPVKLEELAVQKILEAMKDEPSAKGIRIGILGGGCSGYTYSMEFFKEEPVESDWVSTQFGLKVAVDEISSTLLDGTVIQFEEKLMGGGFKFNNPNAKRTCGCGESFGA